ncbi:MAG: polyphosphate kinase 1 [Flavobacteriales bacterium]|nr:polyphosphate kinase 1 [Flavobacteriales bacterium]MCC6937866.1 polyphosphate kinase 1 [Flavobacteriales bacterium]
MRRSEQEILEKAHLYVRRWFAQRMPVHMRFHDLDHTLSVTRTAVAIGRAMRLGSEDLFVLELAALFHDTGYALAYVGHESRSAGIARDYFSTQGLSGRRIDRVVGLIMATRLEHRVRGTLQKVIQDADSAKAGQADFEQRSEGLRQELEQVNGERIGKRPWLRVNIAYLEKHAFHTAFAKARYGPQKRINLKRLQERLATKEKPKQLDPGTSYPYFDRDLSWLSFNERVLQEARDPKNPLLERVKFLAIYSSNLDEFYRVRVASLHALGRLKRTDRAALDIPPDKLIDRINHEALAQQQAFGALWRETLLPALARNGIRILREDELNKDQEHYLRGYHAKHIAPHLNTAGVRPGNAPFIEDRKLYFVCRLKASAKNKVKERLVLVNIPSAEVGRFIQLPAPKGRVDLVFLDDVMRLCLNDLFKGHVVLECHAIKLSRDAELYLDEEFVGNVKEKVRKSLRKRRTGSPARFLHDAAMPKKTLRALRSLLGIEKQDIVTGGRYHHFSDLLTLPVKAHANLRDRPWPALKPSGSMTGKGLFQVLGQRDVLLHPPYQDFALFTDWLDTARRDPEVERISITLYRVTEQSVVCNALLEALRSGKQVTVFVEVQARFDEDINLRWGDQLEKAGARVLYSYEGLKVHCKLCLIERRERGRIIRYAFLGTGNFNERTARTYADHALLTRNVVLTKEVNEVFTHLADRRHRPDLVHLLMAPTELRSRLEQLIDKEIENASLGYEAGILLKVNSLEDRALINKLYDAARVGVRVRLIVRGICCLIPGIPGVSHGIEAISIVDRYLEHARAYVFHDRGNARVYLSSADWMGRNLDRRVEVAFPLLDPDARKELLELLELQWSDNVKARVIDQEQSNLRRRVVRGTPLVRAQHAIYLHLRRKDRK